MSSHANAVQKLSELVVQKIKLLTSRYRPLIIFKVLSLGLYTLLRMLLPFLGALLENLIGNGVLQLNRGFLQNVHS